MQKPSINDPAVTGSGKRPRHCLYQLSTYYWAYGSAMVVCACAKMAEISRAGAARACGLADADPDSDGIRARYHRLFRRIRAVTA
ncbi:MAG TPA: hypothetical protein VMG10_27215 [Gemmataceae bacterium]|nr:hypothetical protein [Gemmataceae bacterium]